MLRQVLTFPWTDVWVFLTSRCSFSRSSLTLCGCFDSGVNFPRRSFTQSFTCTDTNRMNLPTKTRDTES